MALGTNFKRNCDKEQSAINRQIADAIALAKEIAAETGCNTTLALDLAVQKLTRRTEERN